MMLSVDLLLLGAMVHSSGIHSYWEYLFCFGLVLCMADESSGQ